MSWHPTTSQGFEVRKVRHRVITFLRGQGLDLGCGDEKICPDAIGIDLEGKGADVRLDLSRFDALRIFSDGSFDYVFFSHCLEDFKEPQHVLAEWCRVIKPGGYLILYLPDRKFYPNVGTAGANPNHEHDFEWRDIWAILKKFRNMRLISATEHNQSNEYSFQIICQKTFALYKGRCLDCPYKRSVSRRLYRQVRARFWGALCSSA